MSSVLKKWLPLLMAIAAVLCFVGAILILVFPVANADAAYKTVIGIIIAVLMIVLSLLIALYLWLSRDTEPNFFLFDRQKKRNIPVEELTFKLANERLNFLLTTVSESPEELWTGDVLENELKLGYRKVYRPLIAYKMLYDLADKDVESYWDYLLSSTPETVNSICEALGQAGETEMVKALRFIMENYRQDPSKICNFVRGNQKYIRGRIMAYIKRKIEWFY
ncbi:MAG: hypothetical protein IJX13_00030 [Clostridia bacterium]|nr:hypothetical protein [Clostridia bacterium]